MTTDWVDDDTTSAAEKLARFEALNPEPARGPYIPGGYMVGPEMATCSVGVVFIPQPYGVAPGAVVSAPPQFASV